MQKLRKCLTLTSILAGHK